MKSILLKKQRAFTLFEILLAIAILAILIAIAVVAIDPARHLAAARNTQRLSDVHLIYMATSIYWTDTGVLPATISTTPLEICRTGASSCVGLVDLSVLSANEKYLVSVPVDPQSTSTFGTGYYIYKISADQPMVFAKLAELGQVIGSDTSNLISSTTPSFSTPISQWSFNNASGCVAVDNVDGNSGILKPTCPSSSPAWVAGKINGALLFNGIDNYINVPNSANLNPTSTITLAAWVKWSINPGAGLQWSSIINKNSDNQYRLQHNNTNTSFEFGLRTTNGQKWVTSVTQPVMGVWYFVVATYDGQQLKMYVNGALENSGGLTGNILTSNTSLNIGRRAEANDRYFNGIIDEVKIYSTALTAEEIQNLYTAGN